MNAYPRSAAFVAVSLWSLGALFVLELGNIPPALFLALSMTVTLCAVSSVLLLSGQWRSLLPSLKWVPLCTLLLLINEGGYVLAFRMAPAAQVDIVYYMWPSALLLLSSKMSELHISAVVVLAGISGLFMAFNPESLQWCYFTGYFSAVIAAVSWILYILITREQSTSPFFLCFNLGLGAPFYWYLHFWLGEPSVHIGFKEASLLLLHGGGVSFTAFLSWGYAVRFGSPKEMGALSYLIPLFSVIALCLFGFADFSLRLLVAVILIFFAAATPMFIHEWEKRQGASLYRSRFKNRLYT